MHGDRAYRRASIDSEPRWSAIDVGAHEQMVLSRTHQRQRLETEGCTRSGSGVLGSRQFGDQRGARAYARQKLPQRRERIRKHHAAEISMVLFAGKRFRVSSALEGTWG